jgi:hypothetical protein
MLRFLDLAALGAASRSIDRTFGTEALLPLQEFRKEPSQLDVPLSKEGLGLESTSTVHWQLISGDSIENWVFGVVAGLSPTRFVRKWLKSAFDWDLEDQKSYLFETSMSAHFSSHADRDCVSHVTIPLISHVTGLKCKRRALVHMVNTFDSIAVQPPST